MNGILICSGASSTKNIGDYIQTVAQEQFWDKVDCYVERESLNTIESSEKINVIMNGWYMWKPQNFPPSNCINPLFVSIHINPKCSTDFFSDKTIAYLKKYEPIGARDRGTQRLLEQHGISSYFSGCLTLTLGLNYKSLKKNGRVVFVDPYVFRKESPRMIAFSIVKALLCLIKYPSQSYKISQKIDYDITRISRYSKWLDKILWSASFYNTYSKVFDDSLLFNAVFCTHTVNNVGVSDDEKMNQARGLIQFYSQAKIVITSRIHAALPCLGIETPVIFIPSDGLDSTRENAGRFEGLEDLFNIIRWNNGVLSVESDQLLRQINNLGKITCDVILDNPRKYIEYRDSLIKRVNEFIISSYADNPR